MVIKLESTDCPMVQIAFTHRAQQLDLWDTILDYDRSSLAQRLYAFGVVILAEDNLVCAELAPFEAHPLFRALLERDFLDGDRVHQVAVYSLWPDTSEADLVEDVAYLILHKRSRAQLRARIEAATGIQLPEVARYSLDGGRTWTRLAPSESGVRKALMPSGLFI